MWERATEILEAFEADPAIRVVVLSGAGGKAFVSGADISEFEDKRGTAEAQQHYNARTGAVYERIERFPKPTVAMIDGFCIGGGLNLACVCDIRIVFGKVAVRHARRAPGARLSLLGDPSAGQHRRHRQCAPPDVHGRPHRRRACAAHRPGPAGRARGRDWNETVADYAGTIAANAPLTVAAMKFISTQVLADPAERDLARCDAMVAACFASEDFKEGRRAFMEKRKPAFQGR